MAYEWNPLGMGNHVLKSEQFLEKAIIMIPTGHFDDPKHKPEWVNRQTKYKCDGCKEDGYGPRYRCEFKRCDFDLHEACMFNHGMTDQSFLNHRAIIMIPTRHFHDPTHKLEWVNRQTKYKCDGCKKDGYGPRYRCEFARCDFDLHQDCMFHKCSFKFFDRPKGKRICDACGRDIKGFVYHCEGCDNDVHPCCLFPTRKKATSKCTSSTSENCTKILNVNSNKGHFSSGNGDTKKCLPSVNRIPDRQLVYHYPANTSTKGGRASKYWKIFELVLVIKDIVEILLGNPTPALLTAFNL